MDGATSADKHLKAMSGILFWCALVVVSGAYMTTPLTGVFVETFEITSTIAVLPTSLFSLFYALGFLFFGPLSDRLGRKETLVIGFVILTIATLGTGAAEQFAVFVSFRAMQGFAAASFAPTALAYVFDVYPRQKIATVVGLISFGYVAAGIFGQVVAQWIEHMFGWHVLFYVFTGFYAMCLVSVVIWLPKAKGQERNDNVVKHFLRRTVMVFTHKVLIRCYIITVLLLFTFIGMYTLLSDILESTPFNLSEQNILLIRLAGLVGMICALFSGRLLQAFGRERILQSGIILSVVGLILLGFVDGVYALTVSSIVYVAGMSLIFPAIMMLIGTYAGTLRGVANAWYAFLLFAGATVGPVFAVTIADMTDARFTVLVLGFILFIGLLVAFSIRREKENVT